ncbi:MAG: hypothetical protein AB1746_11155 [Candidatus Zixiibacteriota bacterium]
MMHIDEDKLLQFALGIHDDALETEKIKLHLADCIECRTALVKIKDELDFMGSIRGDMPAHPIPLLHPRRRLFSALLRTAAMLAIGIFVGLGIARMEQAEPIYVIPAYIVPSPSTYSQSGHVVQEATYVRLNHVIIPAGK